MMTLQLRHMSAGSVSFPAESLATNFNETETVIQTFPWRNAFWKITCKKESIWYWPECFNTLLPRQNGRHFAHAILKYVFLTDNFGILIHTVSSVCWTGIRISSKQNGGDGADENIYHSLLNRKSEFWQIPSNAVPCGLISNKCSLLLTSAFPTPYLI